MAKTPALVLDLDDKTVKRNLMAKIGTLRGLYEVTLKPRKLVRTLSQNSYYWSAVVTPFAEWLKAEWGDNGVELEQAHELLKYRILGTKELVDKTSGEVIHIARSSRALDTTEFGEFIDKAAAWLAEFCNIVVLPPEAFYEPEKKTNVLKYQKTELRQQLEDSIEIARERRNASHK